MTWLFPLYFAGAAAVIAPILLHLRRRPPKTRVEFSSLMFLEQTPLVTTTRSKIERWLLLLLRCLALLLLAAMFSRPFFSEEHATARQGKAVVVLLDRSASMQHDQQWPRALAKAKEWIAKFSPQDQVSVAAFDREVMRLGSFDELKSRSPDERASKLQGLECGWGSTDLGKALIAATGWLAEVSAAEKRIVLISDWQDGASLESLRGFAWPEQVSVITERIEAKNSSNLSLSLVTGESSYDTDEKQATNALRVRISNARNSEADKFALRCDKDAAAITEGHIAAGATRVIRLTRPSTPGAHVLHLTGDAWAFDNDLFIAPPQPREAKISAMAGVEDVNSVESPMFYLQRALQPTSKLVPRITFVEPNATAWSPADFAVCTNTSNIKRAATLRGWIEQGHTALCAVTSTDTAFLNAVLNQSVKLSEAEVKDFSLLGEVNYAHPLLKPFEDVRLHDFTKIHFWRHRTLDAPGLKTEVLAKFDDGSPAWLSVPLGKGELLLMLSGWQPHDSELALSSKFVPLLFGFLQHAGVTLEQSTQFAIGDTLPDATAAKPGFVTTKSGRTLAVNLAPEESRVTPMDVSKLTSLGVKLDGASSQAATGEERERIANEELESRQQYWLVALVGLLVALGLETWLAGRSPRSVAA